MKLLINIDQKAALRAGIDAPSSTAHLEIEPSTLTERERDTISTIMRDGHDCTKTDLSMVGGRYRGPLALITPTLECLRSTLAEYHASLDAEVAEREQAQRQREAEELKPTGYVHRIGLSRQGQIRVDRAWDSMVMLERQVMVPYVPSVSDSDTSEHAVLMRDLAAKQEVRRAEILEECRRELEPMLAQKLAEEQRAADVAAEKEAERKAAYDALYARLGQGLRDRYEDGYADVEVEREMRALIREDAGGFQPPSSIGGWQKHRKLATLTDGEYAQLLAVRERAPEGATVEAEEVWDVEWRAARDDEEGDDDGEVADRVNARRVITIRWTHPSGLDVVAIETFEPHFTVQDALDHGATLVE